MLRILKTNIWTTGTSFNFSERLHQLTATIIDAAAVPARFRCSLAFLLHGNKSHFFLLVWLQPLKSNPTKAEFTGVSSSLHLHLRRCSVTTDPVGDGANLSSYVRNRVQSRAYLRPQIWLVLIFFALLWFFFVVFVKDPACVVLGLLRPVCSGPSIHTHKDITCVLNYSGNFCSEGCFFSCFWNDGFVNSLLIICAVGLFLWVLETPWSWTRSRMFCER